MKNIFLFAFALISGACASAQLKATPGCPEIKVDILGGTINNNILPSSTVDQIKLNLPCYTSFEQEHNSDNCGPGVFYKEKDIYFFTNRDYIEIGPAFKGKLSIPLMGAPRNSFFKVLGQPQIKDVNWDAFKTAYGVLILYYNKAGNVNKIQFSTQQASTIQLCE